MAPSERASPLFLVHGQKAASPLFLVHGEYEREDHAYDALLGLVAHTARVQAAWTAPRPQYQDNSRQCALTAGGLGLDCPDLTHAGVFAIAVTPRSRRPNGNALLSLVDSVHRKS